MKPQIEKFFRKNISYRFVKKVSMDNAESVESFLERGGEIQMIPMGETGEPKLRPKLMGTSFLRHG